MKDTKGDFDDESPFVCPMSRALPAPAFIIINQTSLQQDAALRLPQRSEGKRDFSGFSSRLSGITNASASLPPDSRTFLMPGTHKRLPVLKHGSP